MDFERAVRDGTAWWAWWTTLVGGILVVVAGAVAFPRAVYDGVIWRYFWGPVVADGHDVACAVRIDGTTELIASSTACDAATGIVAEPGYTAVSTVSYAIILLFAVVGVYLGMVRYDIGTDRQFFFALVPFMFLGGAMRTLEDATLAVPEGTAFVPSFPTTAVLISPFIYVLVFLIVVAVLAAGIALERGGLVGSFDRPVAAIGVALLAAVLAYIAYLATHIPDLTVSAPMLVLTVVGATVVAAGVHAATTRFAPVVNEATGPIGPVVVWGHALDGFANVLSLDWGGALGLGRTYGSKHVINELVVDVTTAVQPAAVTDAIGSAWPFLVLKVAVATAIVWLFNDELYEESPRFFLLMLVAVLALGLGPGTRDVLRATLGI
ncbi:MAG: DUF63 family protein [Halobacteriales archaeon]